MICYVDNSFINLAIMTKEVIRTLKVDGIYMIISYGQPENRNFHLVNNFFYIYFYVINYYINDIDNLYKFYGFYDISIEGMVMIVFKNYATCVEKGKNNVD